MKGHTAVTPYTWGDTDIDKEEWIKKKNKSQRHHYLFKVKNNPEINILSKMVGRFIWLSK